MKRSIIITFVFITITKSLLAGTIASLSQREAVDTTKISNWISNNAIPLQISKPNILFQNFNIINSLFENKKIIALGDGTHGTKEFFQIKHQLIHYLVENSNCTAIAMEMPIDVGLHINNFVKTGVGNIDDLLRNAWWWHQTEEIKDFIVWLKDYNLEQPENKKNSFLWL